MFGWGAFMCPDACPMTEYQKIKFSQYLPIKVLNCNWEFGAADFCRKLLAKRAAAFISSNEAAIETSVEGLAPIEDFSTLLLHRNTQWGRHSSAGEVAFEVGKIPNSKSMHSPQLSRSLRSGSVSSLKHSKPKSLCCYMLIK